MIITCENCETSFNLNETLLKPRGSKVRCSRCKHLFTAYPPVPPEVESALDEPVPPEALVEKTEAVAFPEPESTPEETGGMAAADIFDETIEDVDAIESAGEAYEPETETETDAFQQDFDPEFDIDTVSEEKEAVAKGEAADVDSVKESFSEDLDVGSPDEVSEETQSSTEVENVMEEMDLSDIEESFDMKPEADETSTEDVSLEDLDLEIDQAPEDAAVVEEDALEDLNLTFDEVPEDEAAADEDELEDLDLKIDAAPEDEAAVEEDARGFGPDVRRSARRGSRSR